MNNQSLARYSSSAVSRAADRQIDHERARADIALERVNAIADVTDASLVGIYRNATMRAAVEAARPEVSGFAEMIMTGAAFAYTDAISDVRRGR